MNTRIRTAFLLSVLSIIATYSFVFAADTVTTPYRQFGCGPLGCMALSKDGTLIATGTYTGTVQTWNASTRNIINSFPINGSRVYSIAISGDNLKILIGSADSIARLLNATNGSIILSLPKQESRVSCICFTPDYSKLITAAADKIRLWDASTGALIRTFSKPNALVASVECSPDGLKILGGLYDNTAGLWDINTSTLLKTFSGHTSFVLCARFSPDGTKIATGSVDQSARLWNANTGDLIKKFSDSLYEVSALGFSPDGTILYTGCFAVTAAAWDIASGRLLHVLHWDDGIVNFIGTAIDGKILIGTGWPGLSIKWYDATSYELVHFTANHCGEITSAQFTKDGTTILTGAWDGKIRSWNVNTGLLSNIIRTNYNITALALPADETKILIEPLGMAPQLLNTATGVEIRTYKVTNGNINNLAFSPDYSTFVTAASNIIEMFNVNTGANLMHFNGNTKNDLCVAFSPDGASILSGSEDAKVCLWSIQYNTLRQWFTDHKGAVNSVAYSRDGTKFVTGSSDSTAHIYDATSLVRVFRGHKSKVKSVAFSPDGSSILTGTAAPENMVRLWNANTGELVRAFRGHLDSIEVVAFSPDGNKVLSAGDDGITNVWDISKYVSTKNFVNRSLTMQYRLINHQNNNLVFEVPPALASAPNAAELAIYSLSGSRMALITDCNKDGNYRLSFNLKNPLCSGVYLFRFSDRKSGVVLLRGRFSVIG